MNEEGRKSWGSVSSFIIRHSDFGLESHAIRQLVSKAITAEDEIIDVFTAAGIKRSDISILSDKFLAEVHGLKHKNVAAQLLAKLLKDEIQQRGQRNVVQSRAFSEMLQKTLTAYHNRAIATQEGLGESLRATPVFGDRQTRAALVRSACGTARHRRSLESVRNGCASFSDRSHA